MPRTSANYSQYLRKKPTVPKSQIQEKLPQPDAYCYPQTFSQNHVLIVYKNIPHLSNQAISSDLNAMLKRLSLLETDSISKLECQRLHTSGQRFFMISLRDFCLSPSHYTVVSYSGYQSVSCSSPGRLSQVHTHSLNCPPTLCIHGPGYVHKQTLHP